MPMIIGQRSNMRHLYLDNGYPKENDAHCICQICNKEIDECQCPNVRIADV